MVSNVALPLHECTNFQQSSHTSSSATISRKFVAEGGGHLRSFLSDVRGAAYMNDLGEGLKPSIGDALAKRFWYPALGYVAASVYDKTMRDENGNKNPSLLRGSKELAFQTLASLCGPILLVNLGQNTIGKGLTGMGSVVAQIKNGQNPFANMSMSNVVKGGKSLCKTTFNGIISAAKELPNDIISTIKLAGSDIAHPQRSCKKIGDYVGKFWQKMKKLPENAKYSFGKFKVDKVGYLFGKNGILFGAKGLLGEKGLLFGNKSGRVIGGLLAILLLYKPVDKLAEHIVDIPEKIFR